MRTILSNIKENVFKDKGFKLAGILLIISIIIRFGFYCNYTSSFDYDFNPYSFWSFIRINSMPSFVFQKIIPIILMIGSITTFGLNIFSGYYKNFIARKGYKKYMVNEIIWAYLRGIILIVLTNMGILALGMILYPDAISGHFVNRGVIFMDGTCTNGIEALKICLSTNISLSLFSCILTSLGIIAIRVTHKIYLSYLVGYIMYLGINFAFTKEITMIIYNFLNRPKDFLNIMLDNLFLVPVSYGQKYVIVYNLILFVILNIIIYFIYKNKDKIILGLIKK